VRTQAFGQQRQLTWVDRFGTYLSERRIRRTLPRSALATGRVLDLGCGYHARLFSKLLSGGARGVCVDVAVAPAIRALPRCRVVQGTVEKVLPRLAGQRFDAILLISVLEHLEDPLSALAACRRLLAPGGRLLINVPTWLGKIGLEFSAFVLHWSPAAEMDDHKMYYGKRELWPLLVRAGFKPSALTLRYYKFGLNLFAVCEQA
jgi:SAM-dependent methyltransferase